MKILIFAGVSPNTFVYMMDEAELYYRLGHEVYFVYCDPQAEICWENMKRNPMKCKLCSCYTTRMRKKLSEGIHQISLCSVLTEKIKVEAKNFHPQYKSLSEIKALKYNDVSVGMSSLSNYISHTRNCNPKLDGVFRAYFDELLRSTVRRTLMVDRIITDVQPDKVLLFNGRANDARPEWEISQLHNIPFVSCESICVFRHKYLKRYFCGNIPHSIILNTEMIYNTWSQSVLPEAEKEHIGNMFFIQRKTGTYAGDKNYIANQNKAKLPDNWDEGYRNIVIFNSSEDEFAAVGDEYDKARLFPTQLDAIVNIAEFLKNNPKVRVYLRIHPNLTNVPYKYHTDLLKLGEKYPNMTVIPGGSSLSTYALIDRADVVVVWGSTTGAEAVYHGKPVILLGGAVYRELGITYNPENEEELHRLLLQSVLPPKDRTNAIKMGFYYLQYLSPASTFWKYDFSTFRFHIGKFNHSCLLHDNQKLLGSQVFYYLVTKSIIGIYGKLFKKRFLNLPTEEA